MASIFNLRQSIMIDTSLRSKLKKNYLKDYYKSLHGTRLNRILSQNLTKFFEANKLCDSHIAAKCNKADTMSNAQRSVQRTLVFFYSLK